MWTFWVPGKGSFCPREMLTLLQKSLFRSPGKRDSARRDRRHRREAERSQTSNNSEGETLKLVNSDQPEHEDREQSAPHSSWEHVEEAHHSVEQLERRLDEPRLAALLRGLHNLSDLRWAASSVQVEVREKMLEVGYKRNHVAQSDANFMKELQRLQIQQQLGHFEQLSKLAVECQIARDGLGPLENESAQIFGNWEGKMWVLSQAEDALFNEFAPEFRIANEQSSVSTDMVSTECSSTSADRETLDDHHPYYGANLIPVRPGNSVVSYSSIPLPTAIHTPLANTMGPDESQNSMLLGLDMERSNPEQHESDMTSDLDSGIADLDLKTETGMPPGWSRQSSGPESFPRLLTDFSTRRDRVQKWLLQTTLVSKSEAYLVGWQLMSQSPDEPSNWSQLVVALLGLDEAVSKYMQPFGSRNETPEEEEESMNLGPPEAPTNHQIEST
ncbi:hypothetical protein CJF31_00006127 [Rutstroemia sp. NJR-2017a BVV2]|nr:hypothetical protein CJF31_00006127 [Rutstroemia sp. NJR-2017a BVV2]